MGMKITKFLKIAMLTKDMKTTDLANASGKSQPNVSNILLSKSCTVKTLVELLDAMDEGLVIKFDNKEYKIEN